MFLTLAHIQVLYRQYHWLMLTTNVHRWEMKNYFASLNTVSRYLSVNSDIKREQCLSYLITVVAHDTTKPNLSVSALFVVGIHLIHTRNAWRVETTSEILFSRETSRLKYSVHQWAANDCDTLNTNLSLWARLTERLRLGTSLVPDNTLGGLAVFVHSTTQLTNRVLSM